MNPKQISQDDLVLFALQDVTPAEAAEVIVHLEHSEAARNELARIQGDLATYALTSDPHSPPAMARERLLRQVAKERKVVPIERAVPVAAATTASAAASDEPMLLPRSARMFEMEERAPRRGGMGFMGWAGWAVAAGCAVAVGLEYQQHRSLEADYRTQSSQLIGLSEQAAKADAVMKVLTDGGAMQVSLHLPPSGVPEPPKPEGRAAYVADSGSLVFVGMHLAPLEAYKTYELWMIPADGHDPIPAGIFKPDQHGFASVILPELPKNVAAKTFAVTIEDDGGSKAPTPPIVLAGM